MKKHGNYFVNEKLRQQYEIINEFLKENQYSHVGFINNLNFLVHKLFKTGKHLGLVDPLSEIVEALDDSTYSILETSSQLHAAICELENYMP